MCLQCKEGGFPHDLWLSVSAENVSVYKRGEPKPLETFPYEHIIFFGAPQPCTYKITVDEREMFFETPQVTHLFSDVCIVQVCKTKQQIVIRKATLQWYKQTNSTGLVNLFLSLCCQVGEITKIMKAYINMIVKKRCSVKSVSSYGSNWIR